jgi:hypothetical protein
VEVERRSKEEQRLCERSLRKFLYPLSLRERVGVRDSRCPVHAGESLLLASSLREEGQGKIDFFRSFLKKFFLIQSHDNNKKRGNPYGTFRYARALRFAEGTSH